MRVDIFVDATNEVPDRKNSMVVTVSVVLPILEVAQTPRSPRIPGPLSAVSNYRSALAVEAATGYRSSVSRNSRRFLTTAGIDSGMTK